MVPNQTGYPGPLRWQSQLQPGVDHPLNDAPMSLVDKVGGLSQSVGYSDDFTLWAGPLVAAGSGAGGWLLNTVGAGSVKQGIGAAGAGGILQLATDVNVGDNINLQQNAQWFNVAQGSVAYQLYCITLEDLDSIIQIGVAGFTPDFVTTPSTDGMFFTHAAGTGLFEFQTRLSGSSTVVPIATTFSAGQPVYLASTLRTSGAIEVYAGFSLDTLQLVGGVQASDPNIPFFIPLSPHFGNENSTANARNLDLDYVIIGQERT